MAGYANTLILASPITPPTASGWPPLLGDHFLLDSRVISQKRDYRILIIHVYGIVWIHKKCIPTSSFHLVNSDSVNGLLETYSILKTRSWVACLHVQDYQIQNYAQLPVVIHRGPEARGCVNHVDIDAEWYNQLVPWATSPWQCICNIDTTALS